METKKYSLAARIFLCAGKLPGLTSGLSFYQAPTGEKVNARNLTRFLMIATLNRLLEEKKISMKEAEKKALVGGSLPILTFSRLSKEAIGFSSLILEKLEKEKDLIQLTKDLIGGRYQLPENRILYLIKQELEPAGLSEEVEIKRFLGRKKIEKHWRLEKIQPLVEEFLPEIKKAWSQVQKLSWKNTADRNLNFGFSFSQKSIDRDDN